LKQIRKRLTYANVMSSIAVFLVLGGAAVAATQLPKDSVGSKQLKKESVGTAKIKANAVNSAKVLDASLEAVDFKAGQLPAGAKGDKGDKGDKGEKGAQGSPGLAGLERVTAISPTDSISPKSITVSCPAGKKVVGTGFENTGALEPGELKKITTDEVVPNTALTSVNVVTYEADATALTWSTRVYAICATVAT
jgi:hypothetical protein